MRKEFFKNTCKKLPTSFVSTVLIKATEIEVLE